MATGRKPRLVDEIRMHLWIDLDKRLKQRPVAEGELAPRLILTVGPGWENPIGKLPWVEPGSDGCAFGERATPSLAISCKPESGSRNRFAFGRKPRTFASDTSRPMIRSSISAYAAAVVSARSRIFAASTFESFAILMVAPTHE